MCVCLRLRVCRVHCCWLRHVVGCTVAWLRLVRCNVVRRALSTACRVSHVVPMHQCIPFHSACLVHVLRDCCCCSVFAARFSLPVAVLHGACCTSSAKRRLLHVVSLRGSHVFGCFRMRGSAPPDAIGMSGWLPAAKSSRPVVGSSAARTPACTPPRARLALPPASPPLTDPLAVGVFSAA